MAFSTSVRGLAGRGVLLLALFAALAPGLRSAPRLGGIEATAPAQIEPAQSRRSERRNRSRAPRKASAKIIAGKVAAEGALASGAAPVDPRSLPPPAEAKPGAVPAPPAEEPKVVWSDQEIIAALQECVKALGPAAAEIEPAPPLRAGQCGAAAPVMLRRAGAAPGVEIRPPAMVNCAMAARLAEWVDTVVQPAARETLGAPIAAIAGFSGYDCRFRNNAPSGKLSEHAYANALDIAGFVMANKRRIDLLTHWGPTRRDLEAQASAEAAAKAKARGAAEAQNAATDPQPDETAEDEKIIPRDKKGRAAKEKGKAALEQPKDADSRTKDARGGKKSRGRAAEAAQPEAPPEPIAAKPASGKKTRRGRDSADEKSAPDLPLPNPKSAASAKLTPERRFLSRIHDGACGIFMTVLGPEANEAHRNHFHLDLAPRKRTAFCQ